MSLDYVLAPMEDNSWVRPAGQRRQSQFRVDWNTTLRHLETEVAHLKGRDVTIHLDVLPAALRRDRTALLAGQYCPPQVVVTFDTKTRGELSFRSDAFVNQHNSGMSSWRHNVRAVALTLEALRAGDRYGCLEAGEQYEGLKALPAGATALGGPAATMTRREAAEYLERAAIGEEGAVRERAVQSILDSVDVARDTLKHARSATHPDHRGARDEWDRVEQAAAALGIL